MFEFEQSEKITGISHPTMPEPSSRSYGPQRIASFSTLSWGEHCTECAFPTCYTTCSFYQPRQDGRCRRFENGIYKANHPATWLHYSAYLQFRNWSMLWAQGNATQLPRTLGWAFEKFGAAVWFVANPLDAALRRVFGRRKISLLLQSLRRRFIRLLGRAYNLFPPPDAFLLELYNPEPQAMKVRLWMRGSGITPVPRFEWGCEVPHGFFSKEIPMDEIANIIDCARPFDMGLTVEDETGKRLYVCSAHFVRLNKSGRTMRGAAAKSTDRKIKCVVWDLDQTIWDGILVEADRTHPYPTLRDGVRSVLQSLDSRGILLSVASKNTAAEARRALEHYGLWNMFVAPQINWNRKSESIQAIAAELNIGLDTLAFVDDQSFERDEVASALASVRTYDASSMLELLGKPEFSGDRGQSGPSRRLFYQTDQKRKEDFGRSSSSYDAFLASCQIKARALRPRSDMLARIQDIVERTNQLNTSSNRYDRSELEALITSRQHDCFLVECQDRYGSYGYAGFLVVEKSGEEATMIDCMFSCRIQGKRIDEAIMRRLVNSYGNAGYKKFSARYRKSDRNAPAAEMLRRAGFESLSSNDCLLSINASLPLEEIYFIELELDHIPTPLKA
jgi:FkbH-like protein